MITNTAYIAKNTAYGMISCIEVKTLENACDHKDEYMYI